MRILFEIAHLLVLGGIIYLILDALPKGPLSWKLLAKYSSHSEIAVKAILSISSVLLLIQLTPVFIGIFYFYFQDWPLNIGGKPNEYSAMLLIPLLSQLFRFKTLSKKTLGKLIISSIVLTSVLVLWLTLPYAGIPGESYSFLMDIEKSLMFNFLCGTLIYFIFLDFWLLLKKHNIFK